ncbi:hypothetical protein PR048_023601 [Dryococelus australis]|uniref:Uncharacterized protein n=1 Tax=Dryococelus australis TaxID=614101 RepID=A0ABQ9GUJ6_9NEOP|nr:hypothetical protein PR048_023601 [Dryococelus australis]
MAAHLLLTPSKKQPPHTPKLIRLLQKGLLPILQELDVASCYRTRRSVACALRGRIFERREDGRDYRNKINIEGWFRKNDEYHWQSSMCFLPRCAKKSLSGRNTWDFAARRKFVTDVVPIFPTDLCSGNECKNGTCRSVSVANIKCATGQICSSSELGTTTINFGVLKLLNFKSCSHHNLQLHIGMCERARAEVLRRHCTVDTNSYGSLLHLRSIFTSAICVSLSALELSEEDVPDDHARKYANIKLQSIPHWKQLSRSPAKYLLAGTFRTLPPNDTRLSPRRTGYDFRRGRFLISACGYRAGDAASCSPPFTLVSSQDIVVKNRPDLCIHSGCSRTWFPMRVGRLFRAAAGPGSGEETSPGREPTGGEVARHVGGGGGPAPLIAVLGHRADDVPAVAGSGCAFKQNRTVLQSGVAEEGTRPMYQPKSILLLELSVLQKEQNALRMGLKAVHDEFDCWPPGASVRKLHFTVQVTYVQRTRLPHCRYCARFSKLPAEARTPLVISYTWANVKKLHFTVQVTYVQRTRLPHYRYCARFSKLPAEARTPLVISYTWASVKKLHFTVQVTYVQRTRLPHYRYCARFSKLPAEARTPLVISYTWASVKELHFTVQVTYVQRTRLPHYRYCARFSKLPAEARTPLLFGVGSPHLHLPRARRQLGSDSADAATALVRQLLPMTVWCLWDDTSTARLVAEIFSSVLLRSRRHLHSQTITILRLRYRVVVNRRAERVTSAFLTLTHSYRLFTHGYSGSTDSSESRKVVIPFQNLLRRTDCMRQYGCRYIVFTDPRYGGANGIADDVGSPAGDSRRRRRGGAPVAGTPLNVRENDLSPVASDEELRRYAILPAFYTRCSRLSRNQSQSRATLRWGAQEATPEAGGPHQRDKLEPPLQISQCLKFTSSITKHCDGLSQDCVLGKLNFSKITSEKPDSHSRIHMYADHAKQTKQAEPMVVHITSVDLCGRNTLQAGVEPFDKERARCTELSDFDKGVTVGCHLSGLSSREIAREVNRPKSTVAFVLRKWKVAEHCANAARHNPWLPSDRSFMQQQKYRFPLEHCVQRSIDLDISEEQLHISPISRQAIKLGDSGGVWTVATGHWSSGNRFCRVMMPNGKFGGGGVMMWGRLMAFGVGSLVFVRGSMNTVAYCNILDNEMLPTLWHFYGMDPCYFQDDNARCHVSRSHDLNPIEHLWDELDLVRRGQNPLLNSWNGCKRNGDESPSIDDEPEEQRVAPEVTNRRKIYDCEHRCSEERDWQCKTSMADLCVVSGSMGHVPHDTIHFLYEGMSRPTAASTVIIFCACALADIFIRNDYLLSDDGAIFVRVRFFTSGYEPVQNPPINGIVRHDSHMRNSGVSQPGIEPESLWWESRTVALGEARPAMNMSQTPAFEGEKQRGGGEALYVSSSRALDGPRLANFFPLTPFAPTCAVFFPRPQLRSLLAERGQRICAFPEHQAVNPRICFIVVFGSQWHSAEKSRRYTHCDENTARQFRALRLATMGHLISEAVSPLSLLYLSASNAEERSSSMLSTKHDENTARLLEALRLEAMAHLQRVSVLDMIDLTENPPTSNVVQHDSHVRKSGSSPAGSLERLAEVKWDCTMLKRYLAERAYYWFYVESGNSYRSLRRYYTIPDPAKACARSAIAVGIRASVAPVMACIALYGQISYQAGILVCAPGLVEACTRTKYGGRYRVISTLAVPTLYNNQQRSDNRTVL